MKNFAKFVRIAIAMTVISITTGCAITPYGSAQIPIRQNGVQYGAVGVNMAPAGGYYGGQQMANGYQQQMPMCAPGLLTVRYPNGQLGCMHPQQVQQTFQQAGQAQYGQQQYYGGNQWGPAQRPLQCPMVYVRGGGWRCQ